LCNLNVAQCHANIGSAQESDSLPEKPAFSGKDLWLA